MLAGKQVLSLGVLLSQLLIKKIIIEVLLILPLYLSNIALHMVSISTFNKDNG